MFNISRQLQFLHARARPAIQQLQLQPPVRHFWGSLNSIFNNYDPSRVKEVGADRAAAEWLIRCGAGVKWTPSGAPGGEKEPSEWFRDYNALPQTYDRSLRIAEIDGTDSAVMAHGFKYLEGLTELHRIVFHRASYIEDDALVKLECLEATLKELQVSSCGNVTEGGVRSLAKLRGLEQLLLYDLPQVGAAKRVDCLNYLQGQLPKCKVEFPYAQASELKKQQEAERKKKESDEESK